MCGGHPGGSLHGGGTSGRGDGGGRVGRAGGTVEGTPGRCMHCAGPGTGVRHAWRGHL